MYLRYTFKHLLTRWVLVGAVLLTLAMELSFFLLQLSITSDVQVSVAGRTGQVVGGGAAAFVCVLVALLISLHVPSSMHRFGAGALFAVAQLILQLVNMDATDFVVTEGTCASLVRVVRCGFALSDVPLCCDVMVYAVPCSAPPARRVGRA
jgi:hypothetical protein